jgi:hypothetical protein
MMRRQKAAAERYAERRRREDSAPRLLTVVPSLKTLRLELEEHRGGFVGNTMAHIRPIVVERAPAVFFVPCGESGCRDGGHDISNIVLRALGRRDLRFEAEHSCDGRLGSGTCPCSLHIAGMAEYDLRGDENPGSTVPWLTAP